MEDLASLLWVVNLGCIDLNPWYARCDDVNRPDYLHFDLDPVPDAAFERVRETALRLREALDHLKIGGTVVEVSFAILFGGIVLALALAVGLGSREMVSRSWERQTTDQLEREAEKQFHHL